MRRALLVLAIGLGISSQALAAAPIPSGAAAAHVGETATIEGVVSNVVTLKSSGTILIDIGGVYPNNDFAAVIFSEDAAQFPAAAELGGKTVEVTGPVSLYKGKPEIVLKTGDQLQSR